MKILFAGRSDFKYNRIQVLLAGLKHMEGVEVDFFSLKKGKKFDKAAFVHVQEKVDFIYIPPFRHSDVKYLRKLTKKPVVFDPLVSKYLTKVVDYGYFWKAPVKYLHDFFPFTTCDILIADTQSQKDYFVRKFKIKAEKIGVVPVGADTDKFYSTDVNPIKKEKLTVGCYGSFVPLQGMPSIIRAAELLKDNKEIEFQIIGNGFHYKLVKDMIRKFNLTNVKLLGWVDYDKLNGLMNEFDICLGIFGNSKKSDLVIPNKVYHFAALGKCIISKDTPAIRELFTSKKDIVLCNNDAKSMADIILEVKDNPELRATIGKNAHELMTTGYNHIKIAQRFVDLLENYSKSSS